MRISSQNRLILVALAIISTYMLVVYHGGADSYIPIGDNLDIVSRVLLSKENIHYFSINGYIENVFNGIPVGAAFSGFSFGECFYLFLDPIVAYILNEAIERLIAFIGMLLLSRTHILTKEKNQELIAVGVSLCFAMIPSCKCGFLSIAGQPLILYSYLNILKNAGTKYDWIILILMPYYTNLTLTGFPICIMLLIILIYTFWRKREISYPGLIAIIVISVMYLVSNYKLIYLYFFDHNFISHRVEFCFDTLTHKSLFGLLSLAIELSITTFICGEYGANSLHKYSIILTVALGVFFSFIHKEGKRNYLLIVIIICIGFNSLFHGFWQYFQPYLPDIALIKSFQWDRIYYLNPMLWYIAFGLSLSIITKCIRKPNYLICLLIICQLGYLIYNSDPAFAYRRNNITFKEFYSSTLFNDIKRYINKPLESYRVVSIGMHPSIAAFNGFYILDGYFTNYPLEYKHKFRKIIQKELEKNKYLRKYFDNWSNRCYVFVDELENTEHIIRKTDNKKIKNLELNTGVLKEMGGEYIISAVEIMNFKENKLSFLRKFENDSSPWRIYLYKVL